MKRLLFLLALLSTAASTLAGYDDYYRDLSIDIRPVEAFSVPDLTVSLTDFGAKGDGVTLSTGAFEKAIAYLSERGGGRLNVPCGIWLTGPIELRGNIELHLERDAMIYFSPDKSLYIDNSPGAKRVKACISALRCSNIMITGRGTIDGNGAQWRPVKRGKVSDVEWREFLKRGGVERGGGSLWYPWQMKSGYADIAATPEKQEKMRNDLFRIHHCRNVLLSGVTFQNAPKFHVHPFNCVNVIIDGITVRCPWNAQNGDAIDLSDCHCALIVNSTVDAGDDGICLKSGEFKKEAAVNGCADILIQNNTVYHAHGGFVIGSEDICGMDRIVVRGCTFSGTDTGLRFKSGIGRGGKTSGIRISDIIMSDIKDQAIIFQCDYVNRPAGASADHSTTDASPIVNVPEFTDINISGVVCRGAATGISARGIAGHDCVHGITVGDCTFVYTTAASAIDTATADVTLRNVRFVRDMKQ